jgi:hypothetical protein
MNSKILLSVVLLSACASQVEPAPGEPAAGNVAPCQQVQRSSAARIRLISDREYVAIVRDVLHVTLTGTEAEISSPSETAVLGQLPADWAFTENLALDYQTAAQNVAKQAIDPPKMQALLGTVGQASDAQLGAFFDSKVVELWGRAVTRAEATFLRNIYNGSAALADGGPAHAFGMLLQAVLQAPSFVYRNETPAGCQ